MVTARCINGAGIRPAARACLNIEERVMRILITTDAYVPMINGVVISVMNLKEQLVKRGHEVKIIALSDTGRARKEGDVYYLPSIPCLLYTSPSPRDS